LAKDERSMFRLTQFLQAVRNPQTAGVRRDPPGPVVIWNLIRRCNLRCRHCYSISGDVDFPDELSTREVFAVLDDLKQFGVPVLILSGGEPLLRPDIFAISRRAKEMGFFVGLSSNGTLIDAGTINDIAGAGYDYVGISLDGIGGIHDAFRGRAGGFADSLEAIRLCRRRGIKVGVRFTLTMDNADQLPSLLALIEADGVDKFYLSHLNYAGRGNKNRGDDAVFQVTRRAMDLLFDTCWRLLERGETKEFVTGNNDADGVYLLHWVRRRFPDRAAALHDRLVRWGGNSSGVNVANIDNRGEVHPDTFWWHYSLGNVRRRPFSAIWSDTSDPLLAGLRRRPRPVGGRCGRCAYFAICGGNTRIRALQLTGDVWAEDPGCYLTDAEIGVAEAEPLPAPASLRKDDRAPAG
jgi:heme d1 biosynthesis radical SAM protein NirJ